MNIIYDCETYSNVFTLAATDADSPFTWQFEISPWCNDSKAIIEFCYWIKKSGGRMVGFNNIGFDYPVLHLLIQSQGKATPAELFAKAQAIISSFDGAGRFAHMVYPSDRFVEQIDLFKIHHFDNKARSTSLKVLEFNMRMDDVSDLPFPVGAALTQDQVPVLHDYNAHDVAATKRFYFESVKKIEFRTALTKKHDRDFMNHSDVKIGKEIFQMELEKVGVQCYKYGPKGREPMQTKRDSIRLADCIPDFIYFENPEFDRVYQWLKQQVITETKGVFKDLTAKVGGLDFVFGTGGIHASVENKVYEADSEYMILDVDVTSLYPSIAIEQGYYPEHLGKQFVEVYRKLRTQRVSYKKGTAENDMLKLALNGVYGASNDAYSVFYDPLFTMKVTLSGQMMLAMLAEQLLWTGAEIVQANTDGITLYLPRHAYTAAKLYCAEWEKLTSLTLEYVEYKSMAIADVNNYIAVKLDGETKRKGKYEYEMDWHQNHSALVIAKVAEKVLVEGAPIRETVMNWPDRMDFMMRVKVPRTSKLLWGDTQVQNTCRYYVSAGGAALTKVMPPLAKKPDHWRRIGVESGWTVCVCNDIRDATMPINFEYYINEVEKLVLEMTHVSKNTGNNEWYTPSKFIDSARAVMGSIDCDPASNDIAQSVVCATTYYTKEHSGLDGQWCGKVWMNPPYSADLIGKFCERLAMFRTLGTVTEFITLTNNATDTKWFSTLGTVFNAVCMTQGRIRFMSPDGQLGATPLQGQIFTYSGNNVSLFEQEFSKYGKVMK